MEEDKTGGINDTKDLINAIRAFFTYSAVIVFAWVVWGGLNPPSKFSYNPYKAADSYQMPSGVLIPPPEIDQITQIEREPSPKEIEQWRAERSDLAAQWETADMAHLAFRMGVLGMILLAWTIFETKTAANSASSATDAAWAAVNTTRQIGKAQTRAYVEFIYTESNPVINDTGHLVAIKFNAVFKNSGQSFAIISKIKTVVKTVPKQNEENANENLSVDNRFDQPIGNGNEIRTQTLTILRGNLIELFEGRASILVFLEIEYKDIFNDAHTSRIGLELALSINFIEAERRCILSKVLDRNASNDVHHKGFVTYTNVSVDNSESTDT